MRTFCMTTLLTLTAILLETQSASVSKSEGLGLLKSVTAKQIDVVSTPIKVFTNEKNPAAVQRLASKIVSEIKAASQDVADRQSNSKKETTHTDPNKKVEWATEERKAESGNKAAIGVSAPDEEEGTGSGKNVQNTNEVNKKDVAHSMIRVGKQETNTEEERKANEQNITAAKDAKSGNQEAVGVAALVKKTGFESGKNVVKTNELQNKDAAQSMIRVGVQETNTEEERKANEQNITAEKDAKSGNQAAVGVAALVKKTGFESGKNVVKTNEFQNKDAAVSMIKVGEQETKTEEETTANERKNTSEKDAKSGIKSATASEGEKNEQNPSESQNKDAAQSMIRVGEQETKTEEESKNKEAAQSMIRVAKQAPNVEEELKVNDQQTIVEKDAEFGNKAIIGLVAPDETTGFKNGKNFQKTNESQNKDAAQSMIRVGERETNNEEETKVNERKNTAEKDAKSGNKAAAVAGGEKNEQKSNESDTEQSMIRVAKQETKNEEDPKAKQQQAADEIITVKVDPALIAVVEPNRNKSLKDGQNEQQEVKSQNQNVGEAKDAKQEDQRIRAQFTESEQQNTAERKTHDTKVARFGIEVRTKDEEQEDFTDEQQEQTFNKLQRQNIEQKEAGDDEKIATVEEQRKTKKQQNIAEIEATDGAVVIIDIEIRAKEDSDDQQLLQQAEKFPNQDVVQTVDKFTEQKVDVKEQPRENKEMNLEKEKAKDTDLVAMGLINPR